MEKKICDVCGGTGRVSKIKEENGHVIIFWDKCDDCDGKGGEMTHLILSKKILANEFAKWDRLIRSEVRKLARSIEDEEDLMQDVFVRACENIDKYSGEYSVGTWLVTIAKNLGINEYRKRTALKRSGIHLEDHDYRCVERRTPLDVTIFNERRALVNSAFDYIKRLPTRETIILSWYQGMTYDEISKALGIPLNTVKTRIHNAKKYLSNSPALQEFFAE